MVDVLDIKTGLPFDRVEAGHKEADKQEQAITTQAKYSLREFYPGVWGGLIGDGVGYLIPSQMDLLPSWGTPACDYQLRLLDYMQHGALWSGAKQVWKEKFLSTPYEISGGKLLTFQWQDIFFESEFGQGYDALMQPALDDFLCLNRGLFIEKVSYGEPDSAIQRGAKILGLNHLDANRIIFTGNRETPYIYYSEYTNAAHLIHYTRIIRLADSPSPNTRMFGMGRSKLYNALTVANAQILLGRYNNELLADQPPPGLVIFNNINPNQVENVMLQFEADRRREGQSVYRAPLRLQGFDPAQPATVTFIPLASVPRDFDYMKYMQVHVNLLALVMGLDPQDIWPLVTHSIGSGAQSDILAKKTQGKGPGYFLTRMEREFNQVIPVSLEFKYKAANTEQGLEEAQIAQTWVAVLKDAIFMTEQEQRELAANQIAAFADVLLDESGNVRLADKDPKDVNQQEEVTADDTTDLSNTDQTTQATGTDQTPIGNNPNPNPDEVGTGKALDKPANTKPRALQTAAKKFTSSIQDVLTNKPDTKAAARTEIRSAMLEGVTAVYMSALAENGIDELDDEDESDIADLIAEQSPYINNLTDELYSEDGLSGDPENRASLWAGVMDAALYMALQNVDEDGNYTFLGDDGKESCSTCQELKDQTHRMSWWVENELRPGVDHDSFECGSFYNCQHYLEKVS
jgi:hypothetical protein